MSGASWETFQSENQVPEGGLVRRAGQPEKKSKLDLEGEKREDQKEFIRNFRRKEGVSLQVLLSETEQKMKLVRESNGLLNFDTLPTILWDLAAEEQRLMEQRKASAKQAEKPKLGIKKFFGR